MNQQNPSYNQLLDELRQKEQQILELESRVAVQQTEIDNNRYRSQLLDFVLDAVISSDTDFNLVSWNKAAEAIYGWTAEEVIGQNAPQLFQTEYFDNIDPTVVHAYYQQNGTWRGDMIHHHKDGTPIPIRGTTSIIRDEHGEPIGAVAVLRDISREIEAEQALRESKERYQIISELMSDYAYRYNVAEDGTWQHVWTTVESYKRVTGYDRAEVEGKFDLYHPEELEKVRQDVEQTVAGNNTEGEYRIITKDGTIKWIQIRRRVIWDANQERVIGFYGAGKDITSRKLADEQTRLFSLEQERVSVLRNFIQDASHDLKTPLSTVNTSIYILRNLATSEKQLAHLDKLEFHVNRFTRLIEDMFEMSRLDLLTDVPLSQININAHLHDVIAIHQEMAERKQVEMIDAVGDEPLYIHTDAPLLIEAVANMIENAILFTAENGRVTVSSTIEDGWVVISIEDTGVGITADELPHIFTRFYRGDKARGANTMAATGLGLSIADKIIKLHNGHIDVQSEVGQGSQFAIRLPRLD